MQKDANLVELEKCCQAHIFLQNFVLIQPRTSPPKICKILLIFPSSAGFAANPGPHVVAEAEEGRAGKLLQEERPQDRRQRRGGEGRLAGLQERDGRGVELRRRRRRC